MKERLVCCLHLFLVFSLVLAPVSTGMTADPADTIYLGGTIYTMTESYEEAMDDSKARKVEAVATRNGKVVFAGSRSEAEQQYKGTRTKVVDLLGMSMLPGFVDPHGHFPGHGANDLYNLNLNSPPLGPMNSIEDYVQALAARAAVTPEGEWIIGWGYDDTLVTDMRHPTAADLDRASTKHPIYVSHISGHMAAANSLAMELNDIKNNLNYADEVSAGNVPLDANGNPTGFLRETKAMALISRPSNTATQTARSVQRGAETYLSAGVTTCDSGGAVLMAGASPLPSYQEMTLDGRLPARVVFHPLGRYGKPDYATYIRQYLGWTGTDTINGIDFEFATPGADSPKTGDDISNYKNTGARLPEGRLWFGNWKIIFDGSNQGYTGWFKYPGYYIPEAGSDSSYHGFEALNFTPEEMNATFKLLHKNNYGVEVHGNGNAAIEAIVTAMEEAVAENPGITDRRHTIIHSQMAERQHVERMVGNYDNLKPELAGMYGYPSSMAGLPDDAYMLTGTYLNGQRNESLINALQNGRLIKNQNLVNSYYVSHTYFWGDRHVNIFMGPGRGKNISPSAWSVYNRNIFNYHSDTPIVPISPLRSFKQGVTRISSNGNDIFHAGKDYNGMINLPETEGGPEKPFWDYDQRVNRLMALKAITEFGAFPTFFEDKLGVIKSGAYADFVILGKDPLTAPAAELADLRVVATIVADKVEYGYLPGATDFSGKVMGSYLQVDDNSLTIATSQNAYTKDEAQNAGYALPQDAQEFYSIRDFEGTLSGTASTAVFHVVTFGNDKPASSFGLTSIDGNGAYTYGRPSPASLPTSDGAWWFAPIEEPNLVLEPGEVLKNNVAYIAYFVIADNGGFDTNSGLGDIAGSFALTASALPQDTGESVKSDDDGGGGGSGCSLGGNAFGLELLLVSCALAIIALRRRERKSQ